MPRKEKEKKGLFRIFIAAFGANPLTRIVFSWLTIAYLTPILFLPWVLIAYILYSLGVPIAANIFFASILAFTILRIHMQWRD